MSTSENLTGRLVLYVEDDLTAQYLGTLFQLESGWLTIIQVGGKDAVCAMVATARGRGNQQAFGWQDTDFGRDNTAKWNEAGTHVFRGKYHEIENYMLDWTAMKEGEKSSGAFPTEQTALNFAENLVFAVACWNELYALKNFVDNKFPKYPKNQSKIDKLKSEDAVVRFIREQNPWFSRITRDFTTRTSEESIRGDVAKQVAYLRNALVDDSWRSVMPGKEIFRHLLDKVFHGKVNDLSFAKSIADWQRDNQKIPDELQRLRKVLAARYIP
jgi:hypothetical protein